MRIMHSPVRDLLSERSGTLPVGPLIDLCYSGKYTHEQMIKYVTSESGLLALLGTNEVPIILERINNGDKKNRVGAQCNDLSSGERHWWFGSGTLWKGGCYHL